MKLQAASKKELSRIAIGTIAGSALLVGLLYVLSLVGVGSFRLSRVLLGAGIGSAVAIGNFYILCLTIQKAVETENKKQMQMKFQLSYNIRMIAQAAWVVVALLVPQIHVIAGAAPLLFPHLIILTLGRKGKIAPKAPENQGE